MATYENYKDSGLKWLGQIPSHWTIKKLRAFFDEVTEINLKLKQTKQLQFKYGTIVPKADDSVDSTVLKTISKYTVVKPGDIIINGLNLNFDLLSFRVGKVNEHGVITSAYIAMRPKQNLHPRFYEYLLKAMDAKKVFHGFGTGVRATLSFKELKHKEIPLVPYDEQEAIVAYLGKVTGEIDRAIAVQQKMIDALNERKQIIITRAVTRGLKPDAPLRDSGIDWLGQIPEHWEMRPLRHTFEMRNGYTPSKADPTLWGGNIPWYRMEDIRKTGRFLNKSIDCVTKKALGAKGTFKAGSYILAICTASIGEHAMLIADSLANQRFVNLKIRKSLEHRLSPMFIFYYMFVIGNYCRDNANSTCFQYVDMAALKNFLVPIPPLNEQNAIVDYLVNGTKEVEEALANCERMISLLQERKQIIINEVVTGKKKVI